MSEIRVVVADDQAIVRDGLVTVLSLLPDVAVVGEAVNGEEAVAVVARQHPDVILMDLRMPVLDGVGATERIARDWPETGILILTTFADDASILGALRAGARGYLTKDASRAEVASAVRAVAQGQTTFAPEVGARLISTLTSGALAPGGEALSQEDASYSGASGSSGASAAPAASGGSGGDIGRRFPALTPREAEVLDLVGVGLNNREIAAKLFVSVATVKTHINAIFAKLELRDRAQAIAAVRR